MHRPSCTSYQLGLVTTTRFTRTRHSDIVHPVSSSQLTEARDRVRSFGGYNMEVHDEPRYVNLRGDSNYLIWASLVMSGNASFWKLPGATSRRCALMYGLTHRGNPD
jgi:hypothetical protein